MRTVVAMLLLAIAAATACGDDDEPDVVERDDAQVYATVVAWFADREPPLEVEELRPAFLDGLDDETIPIDVQVSVVHQLEEDLSVRFIDATEEAINKDVEGAPVRAEGFYLRLGRIVPREERVEVDVERYEGDGEVTRYRVALESPAGSWRVADEPAEVPSPDNAT